MPFLRMRFYILAFVSLALATATSSETSPFPSTTSITVSTSTECAEYGCGEPSFALDNGEDEKVEPDTETDGAAPPIKMPPELIDHLKQKLAAGNPDNPVKDSPNTFRIDFGTSDFMQASPPNARNSEREKFIARMNAARNPSLSPSWSDAYESLCSATASLSFEIYPFKPADPHPGWAWAAERLDACQHGPWPGGFTAEEREWRILRADLKDLPEAVQDHYETQSDNGALCVVDGVAFFPPGVVLAWMPLFVGERECEGKFADLRRYGNDNAGERVAGRLVGKVEVGNSVHITVAVDLMRRKFEGKDEL